MSMITAISELKVRRDIYLNNADVARAESEHANDEYVRLCKAACELRDAIGILEAHDSQVPKAPH